MRINVEELYPFGGYRGMIAFDLCQNKDGKKIYQRFVLQKEFHSNTKMSKSDIYFILLDKGIKEITKSLKRQINSNFMSIVFFKEDKIGHTNIPLDDWWLE